MAGALQPLDQLLGHGGDVALRGPGGDDHVVGDGGLAFKTDDEGSCALSSSRDSFTMLEHLDRRRVSGVRRSSCSGMARPPRQRHPRPSAAAGPDRGRGGRMRAEADEHPGRRRRRGHLGRARLRQPDAGERARGLTRQRPVRIGMALEDRNGAAVQDPPPVPPARQLEEVVGTHQPYEAMARPPAETLQRVDGETGSEPGLERHGPACAGAGSDGRRAPPARPEAPCRHGRLQRILRRDQPPDLVQTEALQRLRG